MRRFIPALIAAAMLAAPAFTADAQASNVTCPSGYTCFWPQVFQGPRTAVPNSGSHGFWWNICDVTADCPAQSVYEAGNSALWLYDKQTESNTCITDGDASVTMGQYGWAYIKYGTDHCGSIPTPVPGGN